MWDIVKILENNGWIKSIYHYSLFQWYFRYWLGKRSYDDEREIARWRDIVNRFKGKLVKMIKDVDCRFGNYFVYD